MDVTVAENSITTGAVCTSIDWHANWIGGILVASAVTGLLGRKIFVGMCMPDIKSQSVICIPNCK